MDVDLDVGKLPHAQKDELILALFTRLEAAGRQVAELRARIDELTKPPKTAGNSSLPPSKGQKANRPDKAKKAGPREGSLGRQGGGRALALEPDETIVAKPARCQSCRSAFGAGKVVLDARCDKVGLPKVRPVVTQVERHAGRCRCRGGTTLAVVPEGMEPGTPFGVNIVALAMCLRFVHATSCQRLTRLLVELFGLATSEGALDAGFRRGKRHLDADASATLARLRRSRAIRSAEAGVRVDGRGQWNWVFQNADAVIPCGPPKPGRRRDGRGSRRPSSGAVGVRSSRRPARSCGWLAGLPFPSTPRLPMRHRRGRRRVRPAHEGGAVARRRAGAPPPNAD